MRALPTITCRVAVAVALLAAGSSDAVAQERPPAARPDAVVLFGWAVMRDPVPPDWQGPRWDGGLAGAVGAGWHWTEHLKTEVDAGAATESLVRHYTQRVETGRPIFVAVRSSRSRRTLAVGQQYQFFRNAWFHPHVAAGLVLRWDRRIDRYDPVVVFDPAARTIEDGRTEGPRNEFTARPYLSAGFKAYLTTRVFVRSDLRITAGRRLDETLVRAGVGLDF